jgi:hypothetical protein
MGRGLSELQRKIISKTDASGCIESVEAFCIVRDMDGPEALERTSSVRPHNQRSSFYWSWKRVFTAYEKRQQCYAVSASRALTRLCQRGLLRLVFIGRVQVSDSTAYSERWSHVDPFYVLTDAGKLTVKGARPARGNTSDLNGHRVADTNR